MSGSSGRKNDPTNTPISAPLCLEKNRVDFPGHTGARTTTFCFSAPFALSPNALVQTLTAVKRPEPYLMGSTVRFSPFPGLFTQFPPKNLRGCAERSLDRKV